MIYSSVEFVVLLTVTALLLQAGDARARKAVLLTSSLVFFGWAGWVTFALLLAVVAVIWGVVRAATLAPRLSGAAIAAGVVLLAGNLFLWKYWGWVHTELGVAAGPLGAKMAALGLPVGISFYTLQGIAYLIDLRHHEAEPVGFWDLLLFKAFFGQLIAGPIVRYGELMPQITAPRRPDASDVVAGIELFVLGLVKKIVVADRAAQYADPVFVDMHHYDGVAVLAAVVLYTVQIWADFSGYTDMGRGAARLCGVHLPENFLSPYLATNPSDFWRRWHVTLSRWMRDYLYAPMGGNRVGMARGVFNLFATMAIGGVWHGAAWTFVVWGAYHGLLLAVYHACRGLVRVPTAVARGAMLCLVAFGWLLFRVERLSDVGVAADAVAALHLADMASLLRANVAVVAVAAVCAALAGAIQILESRRERVAAWADRVPDLVRGVAAAVVVLAAVIARGEDAAFIYFQF